MRSRQLLISLLPFALPAVGLAAEPFDYFQNSWSVVGLKDYKFGTRITPDNALLLADGKARVRFGGDLRYLSREQTKTLLDGWLPVVLLSANDGPVRYEFTIWATPLPSVPNYKAAFGGPTDGESYATWVAVRITNTGSAAAEGKVGIVQTGVRVDSRRVPPQPLRPAPGKNPPIQPPKKPVTAGVSEEQFAFDRQVKPGEAVETAFCLPYAPEGVLTDEQIAGWQKDWRLWLDRTVEYWRDALKPAARIEVPEEKVNQAMLAAHVCQLIASDGGELHGGEGFYDEFYIRDGAYQLMEMEEAGLWDVARRAIEPFLKNQLPDGRFETQKGQLDANGQSIWAIWQYYLITADRAFLERAYPQMLRAAEWTIKARRQAPADSPFTGLLPAALADGEYLWDGKHHIVGYDLWNLRGLQCTAEAARVLGKSDEAQRLADEADQYLAAIVAAAKRTAKTYFPASWEGKGTFWGNTETLWPTELAAPDPLARGTSGDFAKLAGGTIEYARGKLGGGFIEGTIRWLGFTDAIHPYMSAYTTMADLDRGRDQQVVEDFYWYLLHSSASHAFPEGIFYKRRFAWSDTIPHCTGASNYAILLRHMLIHERKVKTSKHQNVKTNVAAGVPAGRAETQPVSEGDSELHLLAAVPDWWLGEGKEIRIERAPTHFGELSLRVRGEAGGVRIEYDPPKRNPPAITWLHLPMSRRLMNPVSGLHIAKRPDQDTRWDFSKVVELYSKTAPPLKSSPAGLVDLPLALPVGAEQCVLLDLSALANTDPLTAPFGVPQAGKLTFAGLPTGQQTVGGVPFRLIDPKANVGRGLIVLHSDKAPQDRSWPRSVDIPVHQTGKRLYLLGNVHGWAPDDPGVGPEGALARYVIHYADGQTLTVPLIAGMTSDDWCSTPTASAVYCGLRGKPWHLNMLGVELRPVEVARISFEDLGTSAAPVLAAVTLQK